MAVTVWLSSTDSILMVGQNYVVYLHPETKKFIFAPWDLDRAFGNFFFPNPEELSLRKAWGEDNRFLNRVMTVPAVRDAYLARLEEFQKSLFEPSRLTERIDEVAALIRPIVAEEGTEKMRGLTGLWLITPENKRRGRNQVDQVDFECRVQGRSRPSSRRGINRSPIS
jgi:spore coat protein CotH